jgi:rRNA maturation RNase YbeY
VEEFELGLHFVNTAEMTRLNEAFLRHAGPTDVITFDHAERPAAGRLHGEIFVCVDEAAAQARRFRTIWQAEVLRYVIHGTLHLLGYDDRLARARRKMKREEDRLLRTLLARFHAK